MKLIARTRWSELKVSTMNLEAPLTVDPSVTCQEAIDIMKREGFDQLPVAEADGYSIINCPNSATKLNAFIILILV